jgi:ferredoxin
VPGSHEVKGGLACQTLVLDGMDICRIPRFPLHRAHVEPKDIESADDILKLYPELDSCTRCGACNDVCPVGIDVVRLVDSFRERNLIQGAAQALNCISCGLCAVRCPEDITPFIPGIQALRALRYQNRESPLVERALSKSESHKRRIDQFCEEGIDRIREDFAAIRLREIKEIESSS